MRDRKMRLQAASRPPRREDETAPAEGSSGAAVEDAVRLILRHVGEDPEREGLKLTPTRARSSATARAVSSSAAVSKMRAENSKKFPSVSATPPSISSQGRMF